MIVIEHNMDVIKVADRIIDLGPEGGEEGGRVIATGTPEQVARVADSYTGAYLSACSASRARATEPWRLPDSVGTAAGGR